MALLGDSGSVGEFPSRGRDSDGDGQFDEFDSCPNAKEDLFIPFGPGGQQLCGRGGRGQPLNVCVSRWAPDTDQDCVQDACDCAMPNTEAGLRRGVCPVGRACVLQTDSAGNVASVCGQPPPPRIPTEAGDPLGAILFTDVAKYITAAPLPNGRIGVFGHMRSRCSQSNGSDGEPINAECWYPAVIEWRDNVGGDPYWEHAIDLPALQLAGYWPHQFARAVEFFELPFPQADTQYVASAANNMYRSAVSGLGDAEKSAKRPMTGLAASATISPGVLAVHHPQRSRTDLLFALADVVSSATSPIPAALAWLHGAVPKVGTALIGSLVVPNVGGGALAMSSLTDLATGLPWSEDLAGAATVWTVGTGLGTDTVDGTTWASGVCGEERSVCVWGVDGTQFHHSSTNWAGGPAVDTRVEPDPGAAGAYVVATREFPVDSPLDCPTPSQGTCPFAPLGVTVLHCTQTRCVPVLNLRDSDRLLFRPTLAVDARGNGWLQVASVDVRTRLGGLWQASRWETSVVNRFMAGTATTAGITFTYLRYQVRLASGWVSPTPEVVDHVRPLSGVDGARGIGPCGTTPCPPAAASVFALPNTSGPLGVNIVYNGGLHLRKGAATAPIMENLNTGGFANAARISPSLWVVPLKDLDEQSYALRAVNAESGDTALRNLTSANDHLAPPEWATGPGLSNLSADQVNNTAATFSCENALMLAQDIPGARDRGWISEDYARDELQYQIQAIAHTTLTTTSVDGGVPGGPAANMDMLFEFPTQEWPDPVADIRYSTQALPPTPEPSTDGGCTFYYGSCQPPRFLRDCTAVRSPVPVPCTSPPNAGMEEYRGVWYPARRTVLHVCQDRLPQRERRCATVRLGINQEHSVHPYANDCWTLWEIAEGSVAKDWTGGADGGSLARALGDMDGGTGMGSPVDGGYFFYTPHTTQVTADPIAPRITGDVAGRGASMVSTQRRIIGGHVDATLDARCLPADLWLPLPLGDIRVCPRLSVRESSEANGQLVCFQDTYNGRPVTMVMSFQSPVPPVGIEVRSVATTRYNSDLHGEHLRVRRHSAAMNEEPSGAAWEDLVRDMEVVVETRSAGGWTSRLNEACVNLLLLGRAPLRALLTRVLLERIKEEVTSGVSGSRDIEQALRYRLNATWLWHTSAYREFEMSQGASPAFYRVRPHWDIDVATAGANIDYHALRGLETPIGAGGLSTGSIRVVYSGVMPPDVPPLDGEPLDGNRYLGVSPWPAE